MENSNENSNNSELEPFGSVEDAYSGIISDMLAGILMVVAVIGILLLTVFYVSDAKAQEAPNFAVLNLKVICVPDRSFQNSIVLDDNLEVISVKKVLIKIESGEGLYPLFSVKNKELNMVFNWLVDSDNKIACIVYGETPNDNL